MLNRDAVKRLVYRVLRDQNALKAIAGPTLTNFAKRLIGSDDLVSSAPIDALYPDAPRHMIERGIEIDVSDLLEHNLHRGYFGPPDDFGPTLRTPDLFVHHIPEPMACLKNNVIMTPDREVVRESINMPGRTHHGLKKGALCRDSIAPISGYATLLRGPSRGYYHAQIDNIPRIALLRNPPYRDLPEIKLLRPDDGPYVNTELEDYLIPRIAPSNCRIVDLPSDTLYQVEKYLFLPFPGYTYAQHLPASYIQIIQDQVVPDRPRRREHRIFISRKKAGRRRIVNEDALMENLSPLGFKRYHLADYPIRDKVELFYDAEMVVSPTSSGLASLLYTRDIDVLEILPFHEMITSQYFLSRSVGNRHIYIFADGNSVHDDFRVDVKRLTRIVSDVLENKAVNHFNTLTG